MSKNYRSVRERITTSIARYKSPAPNVIDPRIDAGLTLEPYASFDTKLGKFKCSFCPYTAERFKGMEAHILTECSKEE